MAASPPARSYSRFIVAPDVWPVTREQSEGRAAAQRRLAMATAAAVDAHRVALHGLQVVGVAQSNGFEAMHAAYRRIQVRADDKADADKAAADLMQSVAAIQMSAELMIDTIDAEAHQQLVHVPSRSPTAINIITSAAARARGIAVGAADEIRALTVQFVQGFTPLPEGPPRMAVRLVPPMTIGRPISDPTNRLSVHPRQQWRPAIRSLVFRCQTRLMPNPGLVTLRRGSAPGLPPLVLHRCHRTPPAQSSSPASVAAVGDIGSSGGVGLAGPGRSSSIGLLAALGSSASPLSGSGTGGMSQSGLVRPAVSASPSPAVALQGLMPASGPAPLSSVTGAQTTSFPAVVATATPAQPAASPSGIWHPLIGATTGAVPASIAGPQVVSSTNPYPAVSAPLLPPRGPLGPPPSVPAAIPPAAGAVPLIGGAHTSMAPAAASVATAALTTPAATLPSRVAAAAARDLERRRNESSDLQTVKWLAWELLYATESCRTFALWAVGLMYSAAGDRHVVALTHHGAGYVPRGIVVPKACGCSGLTKLLERAFVADGSEISIRLRH